MSAIEIDERDDLSAVERGRILWKYDGRAVTVEVWQQQRFVAAVCSGPGGQDGRRLQRAAPAPNRIKRLAS